MVRHTAPSNTQMVTPENLGLWGGFVASSASLGGGPSWNNSGNLMASERRFLKMVLLIIF